MFLFGKFSSKINYKLNINHFKTDSQFDLKDKKNSVLWQGLPFYGYEE